MSAKKKKKTLSKPSHTKAISDHSKLISIALPLLFCIFLILFTSFKITGDDDVFWHLATGRHIVETGSVPSQDIFGFVTQGQEWMPFEWGWDVMTYGLYNIGGYTAISLFRTFIFLLIFGILYLCLKKFKVSDFLAVFFMVILSFGIMDRLTPRPHIISLLFFVVLIYIFCDYRYFRRGSGKLIYFIPLIFLIWANVHMGILAGYLLFAVYIVSEVLTFFNRKSSGVEPLDKAALRLLIIIFLISLATALINPNFVQTYLYAYNHTKMRLLETINEWRSPFDDMFGTGFVTNIYKFFLFGGVLILYYSYRKRDYFPALLYIVFAIYSVRAVRFTVDFILIIFVFFVISVAMILFDISKGRINEYLRASIVPSALLAVLLVYMSANLPNDKLYLDQLKYYRVSGFGINSDFIPVQLFDFMKANDIPSIGKRPLNHFGSGGYLVWNFPESKNFIDSRNLNDEIFDEYNTLIGRRPGFEPKLSEYDFDYSIYLAPDLVRQPAEMEQTIISYFSKNPDEWKLVFWDDKSFLFLKNLPKFNHIIDKYEYKYLTPYNLLYRNKVIEEGLKSDNERVREELDRKVAEEPKGAITNALLNTYASKIKR